MSLTETTTKIPTFSGEKGNAWVVFWERFQALATLKEFSVELSPQMEDLLPGTENEAINRTKEEGKTKVTAKLLNALAMSYFTMSFNSPALMNKVHKCKTKEWPSVLA